MDIDYLLEAANSKAVGVLGENFMNDYNQRVEKGGSLTKDRLRLLTMVRVSYFGTLFVFFGVQLIVQKGKFSFTHPMCTYSGRY